MCEGEIVGNSPTLCGEGEKAWLIWLRVQPPNELVFWGECWPKRPKSPLLYVRARVSRPDSLGGRAVCAGGPDGPAIYQWSGSNTKHVATPVSVRHPSLCEREMSFNPFSLLGYRGTNCRNFSVIDISTNLQKRNQIKHICCTIPLLIHLGGTLGKL
jgi:hypothetical protein